MATIVKLVNPCVVAPDTSANVLVISRPESRRERGDLNIVNVVITAGSFKLSGEGPVDADSPVYAAGDSIPPILSSGDEVLFFTAQAGSSSMNVSLM